MLINSNRPLPDFTKNIMFKFTDREVLISKGKHVVNFLMSAVLTNPGVN